MTYYIDLTDPDARPQEKRKSLLPDVSDPERLTPEELETLGVAECEVIREPVDWWQMQGPVDRDDTVRPVKYTHTAVDRPIDDVREAAKRRIDQQRDELQVSLFEWDGNQFQTRPIDRENLLGAALDATIWIQSGGDPDTLFWGSTHSEQAQGWIAIGNKVVPMSASQLIQFARGVQARHKRLIFQGRQKKDAVDQAQSVVEIVGIVDAGWE